MKFPSFLKVFVILPPVWLSNLLRTPISKNISANSCFWSQNELEIKRDNKVFSVYQNSCTGRHRPGNLLKRTLRVEHNFLEPYYKQKDLWMVLSETTSTKACKLCMFCINEFVQQAIWLMAWNKNVHWSFQEKNQTGGDRWHTFLNPPPLQFFVFYFSPGNSRQNKAPPLEIPQIFDRSHRSLFFVIWSLFFVIIFSKKLLTKRN